MVVVVHPATLKFSDAALEDEYVHYRKIGTLLSAERSFIRLNILLYILFVFSELLSGEFRWNPGFLLKLLGCAVAFGHFGAAHFFSNETWVRYRFVLVSLFRTARLCVFLVSVSLWVNDPSVDARMLFRAAVFRTGLVVNVWYALGLPLLFTEHIVLHSIHVLMTALATSHATCAAILEAPASRQLLNEVWEYVNEALMTLAGMPDHHLHRRAAMAQPTTASEMLPHSCEMLLIVAQLVISFGIPTFLLWQMEVTSRQSYIESINREGRLRHVNLDCTWLPDAGRIIGTLRTQSQTSS